jgi:hypothetical protein
MTVEELREQLSGFPSDAQVIVQATNNMDYGHEYTVVEPALYVRLDVYSGDPAVYITDEL